MQLFLIISLLSTIIAAEESDRIVESMLRDKYDSYGEDWIFIPDGNGKPQVAVLKGEGIGLRSFNDDSVTFLLYTRNGPQNGTSLKFANAESIRNSDFVESRETKFITHGWKSSALSSGPTNLKNAYLKRGDYNVILVDWEPLAASTFYLGPMRNTALVGKHTAQFIDFLINTTHVTPDQIHFLGHSLGAHVAGNAGFHVKSGKISRVTGLDPALPGFHVLTDKDTRLDKTDAKFVDVIHTCGGILGFLQPLGTADFYPNGGVAVQPGCCCMAEVTEACSHGRAYVFFTESIMSEDGLLATRCDNFDEFQNGKCKNAPKAFLGEFVDRSAHGNYFLMTKSEPPFAVQNVRNDKIL